MKQQLRKSLVEAFELRGTAPNTRATYAGCIDRFERHFGKSASRLGRNEAREFLLHLVERGLSASTHNVYAGALYFLYSQVLGRPGVMARLRFESNRSSFRKCSRSGRSSGCSRRCRLRATARS